MTNYPPDPLGLNNSVPICGAPFDQDGSERTCARAAGHNENHIGPLVGTLAERRLATTIAEYRASRPQIMKPTTAELEAAIRETQTRALLMSEMRLSALQRQTLANVLEPLSCVMADKPYDGLIDAEVPRHER